MLEKLLKRRAKLYKKMQEMLDRAEAENRGFTAKEQKKYDGYNRDYDDTTRQIKLVEEQEERAKELEELQQPPLVSSQRDNESTVNGSIGMDDKDVKRYSIFRVIRAMASGDYSDIEYEIECSNRVADKVGREAKGMFIPFEVQRAISTAPTSAGALVPTDHRDDMYIDALRADSVIIGMGARVLTDLVGDMDVPRLLGGATFDFVDEGGDSPESENTYDSLTLSPKTITGSIPITRKLTKQSSPDVEKLIEDDLRLGMALAIDKAIIEADGTGAKPTGIMHTTGVNSISIAGDVPTFAEAVSFETALAEDNALRGELAYITTPSINGAWKTTSVDAGSGVFVNQNNTVNGYKSISSTNVPAGKTIFGNWSDILIGMWGVLDLVVDTATNAKNGGIVLRAWQDIDIAIRHPQSFAVTAD